MQREDGFTLVELMVVISLMAILFTLSASALRHYWFTQALDGSVQSAVSQLRQAQQRTDSESAPLVYGVRFQVGSSNWAVVKYDPVSPATTADDVCTQVNNYTFDGVVIASASFSTSSNVLLSKCPQPSQQFAMFFARGTATGGSLTLRHPITGRTKTITVLPLTGRVRTS